MPPTKPIRVVQSQSTDMEAYEAICREAVEMGASHVACGGQVGPTMSMWERPEDKYCRYFVNSPSVFKFAEAGVVGGVYPAEHVAANIDLLARKSQVLTRHGLKGIWNGLEPMWLPESFFARHPHLRGPRVDHPARSLTQRFTPCVDQPEILEAYMLAVKKICQAAPAVEIFEFYTNDAGGGFCWCEFLYPGRNGPEQCRDRPMGDRLAGFFQVFIDGGKAAGREVTVLLRPKHFSAGETADYLARMPAGAGLNMRVFPTQKHNPFMLKYSVSPDVLETMRRRKRPVFVHFPGQGADQGVRGGVPCPFLLAESLADYAAASIDGMTLLDPTGMHWINRAILKKYPAGLATEKQRCQAVEALVVERFGEGLAEQIVGFFRDVDSAVRTWPCYTNRLLFGCSLAERRILFEPLMKARGDVPVGPEEPWHQGQVHVGPDSERVSLFWDGTITPTPSAQALSHLMPDFNMALDLLDRAVAGLSEAVGPAPGEALAEEIDRAALYRCLLATLAHKVQTEHHWLRVEDSARHGRPEGAEGLHHARQAITGTIRAACENTRRLIALLQKRPGWLAWADLEEAAARTGGGAVERLRHKLKLMESALAE